MSIRKLCGTVAVAVSVTLGGAAFADDTSYFHCTSTDRFEVAQDIENLAVTLRCIDFTKTGLTDPVTGKETYVPGTWTAAAIWKKGRKGNGCELHYNLSKQLHVLRTSKPPPRKKGNNAAQGAANAVRDYKDDSALLHLQNFIDTIDGPAKIDPDNSDSAHQEGHFRQAVVDAKYCVAGIIDPLSW